MLIISALRLVHRQGWLRDCGVRCKVVQIGCEELSNRVQSIEKFLIKSEERFFGKIKSDKWHSAASPRSQSDSFYDPSVSRSSFYSTRSGSKCGPIIGDCLVLMVWFQPHRRLRWECLEVTVILPAPLSPSRIGCRCSCPGNSSTSCTASSWQSDRFVFLQLCVLGIS